MVLQEVNISDSDSLSGGDGLSTKGSAGTSYLSQSATNRPRNALVLF